MRRAAAFALAIAAAAAALAVAAVDEPRIAALRDDRNRIASRTAMLERLVARRPDAVAERDRLRAELGRASRRGDSTALVAPFLRHAARAAAAHGTRIVTIAGTPVRSGAANAGVTLDLTLEGSYAGVLRTVSTLSRGPAAASVDVGSLVRKNAVSRNATISAALRIALGDDAPRGS